MESDPCTIVLTEKVSICKILLYLFNNYLLQIDIKKKLSIYNFGQFQDIIPFLLYVWKCHCCHNKNHKIKFKMKRDLSQMGDKKGLGQNKK